MKRWGMCACGKPFVGKFAGRNFENETQVVWKRCPDGHIADVTVFPRNLGSRV